MSDETDLIEVYNLQFTCLSVPSNPQMPQDSVDLTHWKCSFSNETFDFGFHMSFGSDFSNEPPTGPMAMSFVRADIASFKACSGYSDFAKMLGLEENDGRAAKSYNELKRYAEQIDLLLSMDPAARSGPGM